MAFLHIALMICIIIAQCIHISNRSGEVCIFDLSFTLSYTHMKSILVPIDFSPNSLNALEFAVQIARHTKGTVTVFNSYYVTISDGLNAPPVEYIEAITKETEQEHLARLTKAVHKYENVRSADEQQKIDIRPMLMQGLATDNIEALAETGDYDMIAMGTKGASGFSEILWGSITSHVVKRVKLPVLVVPFGSRFQGIDRILYATNFNEHDVQALDMLKEFSDYFEAEITCLHICTDPKKQAREAQRMQELEENYWFTPMKKLNFRLVNSTSVEKGIMEYVKEQDEDLIAVAPEDRTFLANLFHSSVTQKLTFHTDTPMLVVKG